MTKRAYDGVIFDMDGTLIQQELDFADIRRQLGVQPGLGLIEAIAAMAPDRRAAADDYLLQREIEGARRSSLMPGARETLDRIRQAHLPTALLTRNAPQAMQIVLDKFALEFDLAWSRDDHCVKPLPDGILSACQRLGLQPARTLCVGDFHYDLLAANHAGAVSVLLTGPQRPSFASEAKYVIEKLTDLLDILQL